MERKYAYLSYEPLKKCCKKKELNSANSDTLFENIFSFGSKARGKDHPVCFSPCFVKDAICLAAGRKKNS